MARNGISEGRRDFYCEHLDDGQPRSQLGRINPLSQRRSLSLANFDRLKSFPVIGLI